MNREECLKKAHECVCGQREQDYGTPESNFQIIADLWNDYLFSSLNENKNVISPKDVAMMMALLKIARIRNGGGTGDSFVDLAGYAACGAEIFGGKKESAPCSDELRRRLKEEAEAGRLCYSAVADAYYSSPIDNEDIVNRKAHCANYSYSKMGCVDPKRSDCIIGSEKLTEDGTVAIVTDCPYYKDC